MAEHPATHYLSCYLTPPGPGAVFSVRHDQNVALWRRRGTTVELVRVWELERVSGQKHHFWPLYTAARAEAFLGALLAEEGLTLADISVSWGTPGLPAARPVPVPPGAGDFPVHSLAHLFSGLMTDTALFRREKIVAMAIDALPDYVQDGGPTRYWYAGAVADRGALTFAPVESPAPLYTAAETLFGQEPGTLMALASASTTEIRFDAEAAVARIALYGGQVQPWKEAFALVRSVVEAAEAQLGSVRLDPAFSREENLRSAAMKVVQRCSELVAVRNVEHLLALGGLRAEECYLSTSGGYALNCPTNTLLMDRFGFRGLLTPPCANDSGQGIGLGLLGLHGTGVLDEADLRVESAYVGREVGGVRDALAEFAPWIVSDEPFDEDRFVADVSGSVLAWVDGRAEIGPRALGHRSLIGDPRSTEVKDLPQRPQAAPVVAAGGAGGAGRARGRVVLQRPRLAVHAGGGPGAPRGGRAGPGDPAPGRLRPPPGRAPGDPPPAAPGPFGLPGRDGGADPVQHLPQRPGRGDRGHRRRSAHLLRAQGHQGPLPVRAPRRTARRGSGVGRPVPEGPRPRAVGFFTGQEEDRDTIWQEWLDQGYTVPGMFLLARSPNCAPRGSSPRPNASTCSPDTAPPSTRRSPVSPRTSGAPTAPAPRSPTPRR